MLLTMATTCYANTENNTFEEPTIRKQFNWDTDRWEVVMSAKDYADLINILRSQEHKIIILEDRIAKLRSASDQAQDAYKEYIATLKDENQKLRELNKELNDEVANLRIKVYYNKTAVKVFGAGLVILIIYNAVK